MQEPVVATNDNIYKLVQDAIEKNGPGCDLNYIDVSQVTDMSHLFFGSEFIGDISFWNVSNVINMSQMFEMSQFNGDISQWDVSNVTDMSRMFANSLFNGDINRWEVSHVANMYRMFADSQFNSDISDWDVSNVADMSLMFEMSQFNRDVSHWNVSHVKNMSRMFCGSKFMGDISAWDVSNVADMSSLFCGANFNGNISRWNVSNVTDMSGLFWESKFTGDISDWVVSKVTTMRGMFFRSQFDGNISRWDVSNVHDMGEMFYASKFTGDISGWVTSNVTDMSSMFRGSLFNGDISRWDVLNVTDMSGMFAHSQFNGNLADWNVSNVNNMKSMFCGGLGSKKLNPFKGDISRWDVSNVMDMMYMFYNSEFNGNIDSWKVKKETKKITMFWNCPLDKHLPQWYKFRGPVWLEKKFKEDNDLDSIVNKAAESIIKAEHIKRSDIKLDRVEPYIKASIDEYCKKYDIDTDDAQIRSAADRLTKYLAVKYRLLAKLSNRTVLEPIINHAIESIRKYEKNKTDATEIKITPYKILPHVKDSVQLYCQENNIDADNNQIQWTSNQLVEYYGCILRLWEKFMDRTVLWPIISHAIASIREAQKIQGDATAQKKDIPQAMVVPYIKDSLVKYCQENDIKADNNQIQWVSSELVRYYGCTYLLWVKFKDKAVLEQIINHAIESLRKSESVESAVVGQMNNIAIDMVEPYVKESIEKYCQENNVKADDNQMQWVANALTKLTKDYRDVLFQKIQEMTAQAKIKEMLTSDAEDDLS